ncbi:MAG: ABC transporter permease [Armatimonadota bacterium]|nr:ABC transporter permease [Armatimonadota bacterium]MDW8156265.1 ABC transporter permease [Armatimonadota bacterium]
MTVNATLERLGEATLRRLEEVGLAARFVGRVASSLVRLRWEAGQLVLQMARAGVDSVPLVLLTGLFSGMVLAYQTANQLLRLGGEGFVGGLIAVSMAREAAPVFAAVTVAGRVGAGFAAELGTMVVTEQVDALTVMGIDPLEYLVVPRAVALAVMLPVLVVLANAVGSVGGYVVSVVVGVPGSVYVDSVRLFLDLHDVLGGLVKAAVFGLLIALVACHKGLRASGGAAGVGQATTGAVVAAIAWVLAANYFLDVLLF